MVGSLITERVRQLVRMRGPVIPSQISKEIGTNILMASAILSELTSSSDVKISSVKVGGTPLYYVSGQESKLQNYIASLPQKEREAFEQLKTAGVLKDSNLEPAIRVALRQIKDFSKPIEANINGQIELFWKWYLLTNEEAEGAIKKMLGMDEPRPEPVQQPIQTQVQAELEPRQEQLLAQPMHKSESKQKARKQVSSANFSSEVDLFFSRNSIEAESADVTSKSEAEYVVLIPSPIGKLRYYCMVKSKKTCTDSDISSAIVAGQLRKMPVLLLIKGELSRKAKELLAKDIGSIKIQKF